LAFAGADIFICLFALVKLFSFSFLSFFDDPDLDTTDIVLETETDS
jgi:hypothetical protein